MSVFKRPRFPAEIDHDRQAWFLSEGHHRRSSFDIYQMACLLLPCLAVFNCGAISSDTERA